MNLQDIKVYAINTFSIGVSFSEVETTLKIVLLLASIGYTLQRWFALRKEYTTKK